MTLEDHRRFTARILDRQPGLVFDLMAEFRQVRLGFQPDPQPDPPPPQEMPRLDWCVCSFCRNMNTDREKVCCGQDPENCKSLLPHFREYCLNEGVLRIHRNYREDVTALGNVREPGDDNREFRYAAYRHFIFWQYGALGPGNRRVIFSCCVCRIRDKFPDPNGHYTGFLPGV